ncbi:iron-regulated protein [Maritalea myrionectae]|uniref:Iron-regulated protein n=2 Tax=Maritalea myrionectae TaxID=454601 RepID=A0A2R4MCD3_9HYPH|nr:iron-regulated protein [Maritalea myrionectae]
MPPTIKLMKTLAKISFAAILCASPTFALAHDEAHNVVETYAEIAHLTFEDSLITAIELQDQIDAFLAEPTEANLQAAKDAWLAARVPYQQTEAYRFGNAIVDDWEGRVNAWPLDEGLIDYVDASAYGLESDTNPLFNANIIANKEISINGETLVVDEITPAFLSEKLHEAGGVEANVATGYHAIEFLLWGQDLNGTDAGTGNRPATDYSLENCTNDNCDRRRQYLDAASDLLVSDLEEMEANWEEDGAARKALEEKSEAEVLNTILTGLGSLSYGELAGERMKLGLLLNDPEEEHDCFSDNTHNSHYYDAKGIQNVYLGRYERLDGTVFEGTSIAHYVSHADEDVAKELRADIASTMNAFTAMVDRAETESYDQMIGEGNAEGNAIVQNAIDALVKQTRSIERAVAALSLEGVELEGSDSLDNPDAVFE